MQSGTIFIEFVIDPTAFSLGFQESSICQNLQMPGYPRLPHAQNSRNFIHIQDVANVFLFMLENYDKYKGDVFNVGLSNANLSKQELLGKIQTHVKNFAVSYNDYYEDPDKRDYIVSNTKVELTGWSPKWDIDMGINELIMAYQMIVPKMGAEFRNGFPLGYANNT